MAREQDVELGKLAVSRGLLTQIQLEECLTEFTSRLDTSENPASDSLSLVTVMLDKGYVRPGEITELLRLRAGALGPPESHDIAGDVPLDVQQAQKLPESRCGKYVIVRLIGSGGMGAVYRAWDTQLNRYVALKFLTLGTDENIRRFIREAQTAARLNHPNIAQIHDFGAADGRHYIAMEYIEGVTLDTLPESVRRTDLDKIVRIMRDAGFAVEYAHSKGVIHRDIKPQNVMIDDELVPHVMDFGLARAVAVPGLQARVESADAKRQITVSGTIVGTPNYVPPEQARGDVDRVDTRSDVYSLGATLYALCTGCPPHAEATPMDTLMAVLQAGVVPPRSLNATVSRDLETVILKALEKEPSSRYASAREFAEELQRLLTGEPIIARRPSSLEGFVRQVRRHPSLSLAFGALAIVAGFAGAFAWQWRDQKAHVDQLNRERDEIEKRRQQAAERRAKAAPRVESARGLLDKASSLYLLPDFSADELDAVAREARGLLDEAIEHDPEWPEAWLLRARAHEILRDGDGVLRDLDAALNLSPSGALFFERGRQRLLRSIRLTRAVFLAPGLPAKGLREPDAARTLRNAAARDFDSARPQTPQESARVAGLRALALLQLEEAEKELAALPARDADGRWFLAVSQFRRGRMAEAEASVAEALKARPNFAEAHLLRAIIQLRLDRIADAAASVALASRLAPGLADTILVDGAILLARGNAPRAVDAYDRALRLDPRDPIAILCRASALALTDPEAARRAVDAAVQLQAEGFELALALRSRLVADSASAEMDAEKSTHENPDFAAGWHALADARTRRGNPGGAAEARKIAEELDKRP